MSNYAETITGGRLSPVRASGRAYVGFLDKQRADLFDKYIKEDIKRGVNIESQKYLRDLGRYVNAATGRGGLGKLEGAAVPLNTTLFSPRLISSRLAFLNPKWYADLHPAVRRHAMIAGGRTAAGGAAALTGAAALGAKVSADPRDSDFAKIRVGNTRFDVLGGFQQYLRAASQVGSGQRSRDGKVEQLGSGPGKTSRWDVAERFGIGKLAPIPSLVHDAATGTDYSGEPFNPGSAAKARLMPLAVQDALDLHGETGSAPLAAGGYGLAALGIGVQSYHDRGPDKIKQRHQDYGNEILKGAIETGLLPKNGKLTPQLRKALDVRTARYVNREKEGADDTRSRFEADVHFLQKRGIIPSAKAKRAIEWVHDEERDYLVERELRHLSDWYFDDLYGDALADARQKLRERGYDLPRIR